MVGMPSIVRVMPPAPLTLIFWALKTLPHARKKPTALLHGLSPTPLSHYSRHARKTRPTRPSLYYPTLVRAAANHAESLISTTISAWHANIARTTAAGERLPNAGTISMRTQLVSAPTSEWRSVELPPGRRCKSHRRARQVVHAFVRAVGQLKWRYNLI